MGQAKQRGDFQQRKAEAEVRNAEEAVAREEQRRLTGVSLSRRGKSRFAAMLAIAAASGVKF